MDEERSTPVFMPMLAVLLAITERNKGAPLSRDEVLAVRDKAPRIMMTRSDAAAFAAKRGSDIDQARAFESWQEFRASQQPPRNT
jgi:predicted nucleotidyltransferase